MTSPEPMSGARTAPGEPPDYLRLLIEQRWFVIVFVLSASLTALGLTYLFAEKYESYTAISYRVQEVTRFKPQQNEAMGSPAPQAPFKVISQTLQEVLKSDVILLDVVKEQRLDEKSTVYEGPWYVVWYRKTKDWLREVAGEAWSLLKFGRIVEQDPTRSAVEELRKNVKIVNRDSYIFHLYVRDRYPDRAARIADQLGRVLAKWLLEYDRDPGRARAGQLDVLIEQRLREMQQRRQEIEKLLNDNQVASVPLETERLTESVAALRLEESRLGGDIARAQERLASVQAKLRVKQNILADGSSAVSAEHIPPEDFKKLASQLVFDGVELKSLLAKQAALRESIEKYSARLARLPGVQNRMDTLKLSLAALEHEFRLLNDGVQEAAVRATSSVSEVRVLNPAVVPASPAAPIKVYHVALAGGLGLLVAIGLVYLLDFLGIRMFFASRRPSMGQPAPAGQATEPTPPADQGKDRRDG